MSLHEYKTHAGLRRDFAPERNHRLDSMNPSTHRTLGSMIGNVLDSANAEDWDGVKKHANALAQWHQQHGPAEHPKGDEPSAAQDPNATSTHGGGDGSKLRQGGGLKPTQHGSLLAIHLGLAQARKQGDNDNLDRLLDALSEFLEQNAPAADGDQSKVFARIREHRLDARHQLLAEMEDALAKTGYPIAS
jgi:hypothetical protein